MVQPLIYLLVVDALIVLAWWFFSEVVGVTVPPALARLKTVMVFLIVAINAVVIVAWFLGLLGFDPVGFLSRGPVFPRR